MNILLVGVGGQGVITAARALFEAYALAGRRVVGSELHGMSQRGGRLNVHIRVDEDGGTLVPLGRCDLLLCLELIEGVRTLSYCSSKTSCVALDRVIPPPSSGAAPPAEELVEALRKRIGGLRLLNYDSLAKEVGSRSVNVSLLGAAMRELELNKGVLLKALEAAVKDSALKNAQRALELGAKLFE